MLFVLGQEPVLFVSQLDEGASVERWVFVEVFVEVSSVLLSQTTMEALVGWLVVVDFVEGIIVRHLEMSKHCTLTYVIFATPPPPPPPDNN